MSDFSQEDLREFVMRREFLTPEIVTPEERELLRERKPITPARCKYLLAFAHGWLCAKSGV